MSKEDGKRVRIFVFMFVFGYLQYYDFNRGEYSLSTITSGLLMAALVYLAISLYGFLVSLTRNYLIATVLEVLGILAFGTKLDELVAGVSWLTDDMVCVILIIIVLFDIFKDSIIKVLKRRTEEKSEIISEDTAKKE